MEDHVRGVLTPLLALLAGTASCLAAWRALAHGSESVEWAAVATLGGLLAALLGLASRGAPRGLRAVGIAAGVVGGAVALVLLGQTAWLVGRAFRGGPALEISAPAEGRAAPTLR